MLNIRLDVGSTVRLARLVHKFRKAQARLGLNIKKLGLAYAQKVRLVTALNSHYLIYSLIQITRKEFFF
jgi:hypothetical protein